MHIAFALSERQTSIGSMDGRVEGAAMSAPHHLVIARRACPYVLSPAQMVPPAARREQPPPFRRYPDGARVAQPRLAFHTKNQGEQKMSIAIVAYAYTRHAERLLVGCRRADTTSSRTGRAEGGAGLLCHE